MAFRVGGLGIMVAVLATTIGMGAAKAQQAIKFSLDGKVEGAVAPFLVAADKGYYRAEGLDVTIEPAASPLESITRIASGAFDMGIGDLNALIKLRDQNPQTPVKAVFIIYNKPSYAIIGRKSRGVTTPKDIEGKRLGAPLPDAAYAVWPIFAQANGIDPAKVTIVNAGFPVREPMLASGEVDAITGYAYYSPIDLRDRGVPADDITVLTMADYGVSLYGRAILVNTKFAAEKPEAVRGFLRAFVKGLQETAKRPAAAIESVLRRNSSVKRELELERLRLVLRDHILTREVKVNGLGAVDQERLETSIEQIGRVYAFKNAKPKLESLFDASFLPSPPPRILN